MLMEQLAGGRAVSLPAGAVGGMKAVAAVDRRLLDGAPAVRHSDRPHGRRRGEGRQDRGAHLRVRGARACIALLGGRQRHPAAGRLGDAQGLHHRDGARARRSTPWTCSPAPASCRARTTSSARATPSAPVGDHGRRRQHHDAHADDLRPGRDALPSVCAERGARRWRQDDVAAFRSNLLGLVRPFLRDGIGRTLRARTDARLERRRAGRRRRTATYYRRLGWAGGALRRC